MPQLDIYSLGLQIVSFSIMFVITYSYIVLNLIPDLYKIIRGRTEVLLKFEEDYKGYCQIQDYLHGDESREEIKSEESSREELGQVEMVQLFEYFNLNHAPKSAL